MTVLLIPGRERAIGAGAPVRRVLPWVHRRAVGPFVFWDHFGPEPVGEGRGLVVGEHPHIGLSTLTWMFTGEIEHRDSLGTFQVIRAGEVNWMTAGRGIAHTELGRASADGAPLEGIQLWVALPRADEQGDPSFDHRGASELPEAWVDGVAWRVVAGALGAARSPVPVRSPLVLADARLADGQAASIDRPPGWELAVYVASGRARVGGEAVDAGVMAVVDGDGPLALTAEGGAHVLLLGGAPLPEPRHLWWNFVASDPALIDAARADWAARAPRFGSVAGGLHRIDAPPR